MAMVPGLCQGATSLASVPTQPVEAIGNLKTAEIGRSGIVIYDPMPEQ
jgi:hypothetical protein